MTSFLSHQPEIGVYAGETVLGYVYCINKCLIRELFIFTVCLFWETSDLAQFMFIEIEFTFLTK
jgi:hypothetical protein